MSGLPITSSFGPQFASTATGSPSVARGAEVAAHDAARGVVNVLGAEGVDALDAGTLSFQFGLSRATAQASSPVTLGGANSVAVSGNTLAVAYNGRDPAAGTSTDSNFERGVNGAVVFYDLSGGTPTISRVVTGPNFATPDQVVFTPDGSKLLVAIEGEPNNSYTADARGGVAIIDVATGALTFAGFDAFDAQEAALRAAGVRLIGRETPTGLANTADPSRDLEPEYIAVNAAGTTAYVSLQENNALGVLDIASGSFTAVLPFGLQNHNLVGNALDASDRDGGPKLANYPIFGMYQPDGIATFEAGGRTFVVTANEGDAREWGNFVEPIRISDSAVVLDPTAFPTAVAARLKDNAQAGRLEISRFTGDTDGDGDYDQLHVFGGRSVSIWEVTGGGTGLTLRWDSGQTIDATLAAQVPGRYDDSRSDNKGAEPEGLSLATIDGQLHALVGLERANMLMSFRIDTSAVAGGGNPTATLSGLIGAPLPATGVPDVAPEVFTYIPGAGGTAGTVTTANEVSATVRNLDLSTAAPGNYTLQILHASDFEAGLLATTRAPNFAAIVGALEGTYANSITLSSGDNYIPGPFLAAGTDPGVRSALQAYYEQLFGLSAGALSGLREAPARMDIAILNAIGIQASVFGNHEFDLGTNVVADAIDFIAGSGSGTGRISSIGAQFPYLSANLDFSGDAALRNLVTATLREASTYATTRADLANDTVISAEAADAQISPWTTIVENGETIGILGATTQILRSISSAGGVQVIGDDINDMPALAAILQPYVDQMTAQGINKIVLLSHLQQNAFELQLATLLRGVDVIIAGGSNAIFADGNDPLAPGDTAANTYPVFRTGADGRPVAVVNTGGEYSYVGRLVVTFDGDGVVIPASVDAAISGAYVTTEAGVDRVAGNNDGTLSAAERAAIFADGTRGGEVKQLADAVGAVIAAKDGNVFGYTDVFLEGRRGEVRTEETNLGNLTADANLAEARDTDPTVTVSLKNGGGIRAEIGAIIGQPIPAEVPPLANPAAGKPAGGVSQLDIENSLRFNNALSVATFTAENLVNLLENALRGVAPGATPGSFPQVSGLEFSFDATRPAGDRILTLTVEGTDGTLDILVSNGELVGDPSRAFRVVTLSFLLDGGDGWTANGVTFTNRVDLAPPTSSTAFTTAGREQAALAEYLAENFATPAAAFDQADTTPANDERIQNLAARADGVLPDAVVTDSFRTEEVQGTVTAGPLPGAFIAFTTSGRSEVIQGTAARDIIDAGAGDDLVQGGLGADSLSGDAGADTLFGDAAADTLDGGIQNDSLDGGEGNDRLLGGLGADTLTAGAGTDTLQGGEGAGTDTLQGGEGADLYILLTAGHVVTEADVAGRDTVQSAADYTLGEFLEDLILTGTAVSGTGNAIGNVIDGNAGNNTLAGGAGRDTLRGGDGNDTLDGQTGRDVLEGGGGNDLLIGSEGGDTLTGGAGQDIFRFTSRFDSYPGNPVRQAVVTDFVQGQDRIQLAFDANEALAGVQGFSFTAGGFASFNPGFIRVEAIDATSSRVLANINNNAAAEFELIVRGTNALTAADFIL